MDVQVLGFWMQILYCKAECKKATLLDTFIKLNLPSDKRTRLWRPNQTLIGQYWLKMSSRILLATLRRVLCREQFRERLFRFPWWVSQGAMIPSMILLRNMSVIFTVYRWRYLPWPFPELQLKLRSLRLSAGFWPRPGRPGPTMTGKPPIRQNAKPGSVFSVKR